MHDMSNTPAIYAPINDDPQHGPAFAKLSPQQRAFVTAYLETGARSASEAARLAGYAAGGQEQSVRAAGSRLLQRDDVLAAIKELADKKVKTGAYVSMAVLLEIAQDTTHKDRFKAAVEIANRSGMIVAQKVEHEHRHELTVKETVAQLKAFAKELGLNEKQVLGAAGYTDAEFEDVTGQPLLTDEREPDMSSAGLEDLLG